MQTTTHPTLISRFRILSRLASGGMADVYLAEDLDRGTNVALKVLESPSSEEAARFEREIATARLLHHPHIVRTYDAGRADDGSWYLAMEYLPGGSLKHRIRDGSPISEDDAVRLAIQVAGALAYAHERGIIHRDVKSHNILLDAEGNARLADFGIARPADAPGLTQTHAVLGSPHYISPEQARGKPADPRSDLYSLGVVLYECVTGHLPFDGENAIAVATQHVTTRPSPPRGHNPHLSRGLESVILRVLEKAPEDRYQSAHEMSMALDATLHGILPPTVSPGDLQVAPTQVAFALPAPSGAALRRGRPQFGRRPRQIWLLPAALLLAAAIATGYGRLQSASPEQEGEVGATFGGPTSQSPSDIARPADRESEPPALSAVQPTLRDAIPATLAPRDTTSPPRAVGVGAVPPSGPAQLRPQPPNAHAAPQVDKKKSPTNSERGKPQNRGRN